MEDIKRETVGKKSLELQQKEAESRDPIELEREMQKDYLKELIACTRENALKIAGDFFVVVLTKNERLMPNVFRNYFFARSSCPTPEYDQSVFKYVRADEELHYLWTVPSKDACIHLKDNMLYIPPEEQGLLRFVLEFYDGTLYRLAKKLNGEQDNSPLFAKG